MPLENFADLGTATVSSGGTDTPSAGSSETVTFSSSTLPTVSSTTTPPTHCYVRDVAAPSELMEVTAGGSGSSTMIRGALGTTPVSHSSGYTVEQVISTPLLGSIPQRYNVRSPVYGAKGDGSTDDYAAIQAALTACRTAGGGIVYVPEGIYLSSGTLQIGSNTVLMGAGKGLSTIRMKSGSWSSVTQVNSINGLGLLITYGNTTASYIAICDLTIDGNQTGVTALPSWATGGTGVGDNVTNSPLHLNDVTNLLLDNVEVINSIGYTVYLQLCTNFTVKNCRIVAGQTSSTQTWGAPSQQDGLHLDGCIYGAITDNYIDTGTYTTDVGDDTIALQSLSGVMHDITISGNILQTGESGVDLALSGYAIWNVAITGNVMRWAANCGVIIQPFTTGGVLATNISITGNAIYNTGNATGVAAIMLLDYTAVSSSGASWQGISITGNTIAVAANGGQLGISAQTGSDLTVAGNTISNWNGSAGVIIGAPGHAVTNFMAANNTIDMSASTQAGCAGLLSIDSSFGTFSGNLVTGPGTSGTQQATGVTVQANSVSATNVTVSNNQVSNWWQGVLEYNGGISPDNNTFAANNIYNCTSPVLITGGHTLYQPSLIGVGGITDSEQFVVLSASYTLTSSTTAQKLFNATTNGALTVIAGTTYFFETEFELTNLYTSTANAQTFGFGGTATFTSLKWYSQATPTVAGTLAADNSIVVTTTTATALTATSTTGAMRAKIRGVLRVNAAGTVIPQITLGHANAAIVSANSWFRIWPVGSNTVTSAGNWS